jgi:hypothetical protein
VAISIPVEVLDREVNFNCTLTLVRHWIRLSPDPNATGPTAFEDNVAAIESIVTSSGDNDSGLFEANLRDERYLPFEGAGAVSVWKIEMPQDTNELDTSTVTDAVLHLRYTARDGGEPLRTAARSKLQLGGAPAPGTPPALPTKEAPLALARLFSAKQDFSGGFERFLDPDPTTNGQAMVLDLSDGRFPYHDPAKTISLSRVRLVLLMQTGSGDPSGLKATLVDPSNGSHDADPPPGQPSPGQVAPDGTLANLPALSFSLTGDATGTWTLQVAEAGIPQKIATSAGGHTRIDPSAIVDVAILCEYSLH